jgi:Ran GTPase-activating protein 1
MKSKEELTRLELSFNMLGKKSGIYLNEILRGLVKLQVLDLQSNYLTDSSIPFILSALKTNKALQSLYLGNNSITKASAVSIAQYLYLNKNLLRLWLDSNHLSSEGVGIIGKILGGAEDIRGLPENSEVINKNDDRRLLSSLPSLREINLANVHADFEGTQMFFNYLKENKNISRIIFHSNNIGDIGCINIADYLSTQVILDDNKVSDHVNNIHKDKASDNDEDCNESIYNNSECDHETGLAYLSLSNNNISDDGAKILAEQFLKHKHLKEIKLNSNLISDAGAELLLYSVLCNNSIIKFNIENNNTTWRDKNIDVKNIRSNIQIFF